MKPTPTIRRWLPFPALLAAMTGCGSDAPHPPVPQPESGSLKGLTSAHNAERAATDDGLPPLAWDDEIAGVAQAWSDKLAQDGCQLVHSTGNYGENLFWSSPPPTAEEVVDAWVSEKGDYTYGPFGSGSDCTEVCGHYTQVVWRATERLGCGAATCANGGQVWTCNYDPPGNWIGQEPY